MGKTIEKMYGSYSDADLNDWERFPMNVNVLTSSAFGAWLLRRDERRDKAILKADYENRLKADLVAMLTEIKNKLIDKSWNIDMYDDDLDFECCYLSDIDEIIQQKINSLKGVEKMGTSNAFLKVRTFVKNCPVSFIGSDSVVMVARLVDGELWYYGLYDTWERAEEVAKELGNGVVFEIDSPEGNK